MAGIELTFFSRYKCVVPICLLQADSKYRTHNYGVVQRGLLRGSALDLTPKRGPTPLDEVDPPTWDLEVAEDEPLS